jgi:hypothetical protein
MEGEMRIVEEQLNKLCAQHDELMSLLDIYDYIPNQKGLSVVNRNVSHKLAVLQEQVRDLEEQQAEGRGQNGSPIKEKERQLSGSVA